MPKFRSICALIAALALSLAVGGAFAQGAYPSKVVKVVVPYPAGGIVDIVARAITDKIASSWGQPIIIEPRPGANSNLGTEQVAKSAPDGYTWLVTGPAILSNPAIYGNLSWNPVKDFTTVGLAVWNLNIAVVPASLPVNSMKEFVEYTKARPGQLNFGNPGTGSSNHLSTELFLQVAGLKMVNIGYKGQPPAIPDLLNGQLHFKIVALGLALPHVQSGKLKALATFSHERLKQMPQLPTIAETGYREAALVPWYGIYVPAGTPKDVVTRIHAEIGKALQAPEVQDRLEKSGSQPGTRKSLEELATLTKDDYERWSKVVQQAGIKPQ
jgi:tripartite-type tricarboxylate transporter receptor subunit TctC